MREIKFRVWDIKEKKMIIDDINPYGVESSFSNLNEDIVKIQKDFELMQYTGLNDKNGKEIYEFDRVKRENEIGEVRWDDIEARFRIYFDDNNPMPRNYPLTSELEVVGNRYEKNLE